MADWTYLWDRFQIKPEEAQHAYPAWQIEMLLAARDSEARQSAEAAPPRDLTQSPYAGIDANDYPYL